MGGQPLRVVQSTPTLKKGSPTRKLSVGKYRSWYLGEGQGGYLRKQTMGGRSFEVLKSFFVR